MSALGGKWTYNAAPYFPRYAAGRLSLMLLEFDDTSATTKTLRLQFERPPIGVYPRRSGLEVDIRRQYDARGIEARELQKYTARVKPT